LLFCHVTARKYCLRGRGCISYSHCRDNISGANNFKEDLFGFVASEGLAKSLDPMHLGRTSWQWEHDWRTAAYLIEDRKQRERGRG
jgi:hypothetical protein